MDATVEIFENWELANSPISNYWYCALTGQYYEPPFKFDLLNKLLRLNTHHQSAISVKTNILSSCFKETSYLSYAEFNKFIYDYVLLGNAYLKPVRNRLGGVIKFTHSMANYIRVKQDSGYLYINQNKIPSEYYDIPEIIHVKTYDASQNIYGAPDYLAAVLDIVLNYSATLFRYKYYKNGSHAGFILSLNGELDDGSLDAIKSQLKDSKGGNNFKNLLVHIPKGDHKSVQLIPISEIGAKDEFERIKNVSRDDILAAHRVPPELLSIMPTNTAGFGNIKDRATVFYVNELEPIIKKLESINQQLNMKIFEFEEYRLMKE